MNTYTVGTKVFLDFHFGGKPRGKVVKVIQPGNGRDIAGKVSVKLSETVGAYQEGETLEVSTYYAVPIKQELKLSPGQFHRRISTDYQFA